MPLQRMNLFLLLIALSVSAQDVGAQLVNGAEASFKTPVGQSDLRIAKRASELLNSADKWNRGDIGDCSTDTSGKLTLYCALDQAGREVSGKLDETSAVRQETRAVIAFLSVDAYGIDGYNSDPNVTFSEIQEFFRVLQHRLLRRMLKENPAAGTQNTGGESEARPPVSEAELRIVHRAQQILSSVSKWNRADTRNCPARAKNFSVYCALEQATKEISGTFEHRGAAMQEARFVIDDIAPNAGYYGHRLMDFNNDPATTFFDVQKFFTVLEAHLLKRLAQRPSATAQSRH